MIFLINSANVVIFEFHLPIFFQHTEKVLFKSHIKSRCFQIPKENIFIAHSSLAYKFFALIRILVDHKTRLCSTSEIFHLQSLFLSAFPFKCEWEESP